MRAWLRDQGFDKDIIVPLVYAGIVLPLFEYRLLPDKLMPVVQEYWPQLNGDDAALRSGLIWVMACAVLFLGIPLLLNRFVHQRKVEAMGFRLRGFLKHAPIYIGMWLVMTPLIYWAAQDPGFLETYPFILSAREQWSHFLSWEPAYLFQFFALEAFFRGYLLFTLARRMGNNAAFVAAVPYTMIHFHKPEAECLGALLAGILLGLLALRYRSFLGGALLHALVAATMDYLACRAAGLF